MSSSKKPPSGRKPTDVKRVIRTNESDEGGRQAGPQPRIVVVQQKTSPALIITLVAVGGLLIIMTAIFVINRYASNNGVGNPTAATSPASEGSAPAAPTAAKIPAAWSQIGVIKGELQTIAFDPSNPKNQLLGTNGAGLQISKDSGKTWKPTSLNAGAILDVSVNPDSSDHMIAATTEGFKESTDGGKTWSDKTGLPGGEYHAAQFDPNNPEVVWAALWKADPTLYISKDGGKTWKPASGGPQQADINFVSFDKRSGLTYVGSYGKGLWSTSDNGKTWQDLNSGLPTNTDITLIALTSDPTVMFVGTHDYGVYRSEDGGKSWESANSGKEQANDVHGLVVHPKDPNTIYAAGMMMGKGVFVSKDRGATWQPLETGSINLDDVHVFSGSPDNKSIIMGSGEHGGEPQGTLYRTDF